MKHISGVPNCIIQFIISLSVFAYWLVNLRSVTCFYTDQNFKSSAHFAVLNLSSLNILTLWTEPMKKLSESLSYWRSGFQWVNWKCYCNTYMRRWKSTGWDSRRFNMKKRAIPSTNMITNISLISVLQVAATCFARQIRILLCAKTCYASQRLWLVDFPERNEKHRKDGD